MISIQSDWIPPKNFEATASRNATASASACVPLPDTPSHWLEKCDDKRCSCSKPADSRKVFKSCDSFHISSLSYADVLQKLGDCVMVFGHKLQ